MGSSCQRVPGPAHQSGCSVLRSPLPKRLSQGAGQAEATPRPPGSGRLANASLPRGGGCCPQAGKSEHTAPSQGRIHGRKGQRGLCSFKCQEVLPTSNSPHNCLFHTRSFARRGGLSTQLTRKKWRGAQPLFKRSPRAQGSQPPGKSITTLNKPLGPKANSRKNAKTPTGPDSLLILYLPVVSRQFAVSVCIAWLIAFSVNVLSIYKTPSNVRPPLYQYAFRNRMKISHAHFCVLKFFFTLFSILDTSTVTIYSFCFLGVPQLNFNLEHQ